MFTVYLGDKKKRGNLVQFSMSVSLDAVNAIDMRS